MTFSLALIIDPSHSLKFSLSHCTPVLLTAPASLSRAPQELRMASEQEEFAAASEKSLVTMRPNASHGEVNWATGALPAMAPWGHSDQLTPDI